MADAMSAELNQPYAPPPPGQTSDFSDNAANRIYQLYIVAGVCLVLVLLFASARYFAKRRVIKHRTWDDLTCLLGVIGTLAYTTIVIGLSVGRFYGYHSWDVSVAQALTSQSKAHLVLLVISTCLSGPALWLVKLSVFVLYLELFSPFRWLRITAICGILISGLYFFGITIAFAILCSPLHGHSQMDYFNALLAPRCQNHDIGMAISNRAGHLATDVFLILLPLPAVWSLHMPFKRKLGVSAMFLTGILGLIASTLGLYYQVTLEYRSDTTWDLIPAWITSIVEMTAGVMICCMPTVAQALKAFHSSWSQSRSTKSSSHYRLGSSSANTAKIKREASDSTLQPIHLEQGYFPGSTGTAWSRSEEAEND
ncbi:hypothetical protein EV356DRAFT_257882 [Viridothelium virens]|uniref:Rhodopsin domain-containing protein n=1 Tax=Viridothelium virens TaxID=1048519 RepID=A0A6A6H2W3_VIRVR|nr:hypothetical protein EV356DRAFT_257882 [Viridothelium virens]